MNNNLKNNKQTTDKEMENICDFRVDLEEHLQALQFDDRQRNAAVDIIEKTGALIEDNGIKYISIHRYTEGIIAILYGISNEAIDSKVLEDLKEYESFARSFLSEWAIIVGGLSHHFAEGKTNGPIEGEAESLKKLMNDMRIIFGYLITADELLIEFGLKKGKSDPPGLEIE